MKWDEERGHLTEQLEILINLRERYGVEGDFINIISANCLVSLGHCANLHKRMWTKLTIHSSTAAEAWNERS